VTVAPNKLLQRAIPIILKKMIFQRLRQLLIQFFSGLTVEKLHLAKGRIGAK